MPRQGFRYVSACPSPVNPIRSVPLFRPASAVFGSPSLNGRGPVFSPAVLSQPLAPLEPSTRERAEHALRCAEARVRELRRCYVVAREGIAEANRTVLPTSLPPATVRAILAAGGTVEAKRLSPERVRERKSAAFRLLNKRRAELKAAERALVAARAALEATAQGELPL